MHFARLTQKKSISAKTAFLEVRILHQKLTSLGGGNVFPYKHVVDLRTKVIPRHQSRALAIPEAKMKDRIIALDFVSQ
jgi:hypothetical protein